MSVDGMLSHMFNPNFVFTFLCARDRRAIDCNATFGLKAFFVLYILGFGLCGFAFGAALEPTKTSSQDPQNLQSYDALESFKAKRNLKTAKLREQIVQTQPMFRKSQTALAKTVVDRKVTIMREREFLTDELERGIDKLYQKAVKQYNQKQFAKSQKDFMELEQLSANYRETRQYLEKLRVLMAAGKDAPKDKQ